MTLREFTKEYLPLPDADLGDNIPFWRKVFPTNLRWHNTILSQGYYKRYRYINPTYTKELEEQWERVHKDEIIDTEWRKLYTY